MTALAVAVAGFSLALAVAFALGADVVTEHGSEDKVLLGSQLVQWTSDNQPDSLQTLAPTEIQIDCVVRWSWSEGEDY